MENRTAIITGITGQDGAYLAQLLLRKGYIVYGTFRRTSSINFWRIENLGIRHHPQLNLIEYDLTDLGATIAMLQSVKPDEIYNLAAQSYVHVSFQQPGSTAQISALGVLNLLEAIRLVNPKIRFYQAGTSEMFGKVQAIPQKEDTPFYPRSPYAAAKLYAHWLTINYRESYDIFGATGILFNHESPLRGQEFVTRKITHAVARIVNGEQDHVSLGNLDAKRDWGYAKEYVEGMWRMLQVNQPDTYILATGRTETVRDFARLAFKAVGININFQGKGEREIGVVADVGHSPLLTNTKIKEGQVVVRIDPKHFRPAEVDLLIGSPEKAVRELGWGFHTSLEQLCQMMVESDLKMVDRGFSF